RAAVALGGDAQRRARGDGRAAGGRRHGRGGDRRARRAGRDRLARPPRRPPGTRPPPPRPPPPPPAPPPPRPGPAGARGGRVHTRAGGPRLRTPLGGAARARTRNGFVVLI